MLLYMIMDWELKRSQEKIKLNLKITSFNFLKYRKSIRFLMFFIYVDPCELLCALISHKECVKDVLSA